MRTRALSGDSRDPSIGDRTNGDLKVIFEVIKVTKIRAILHQWKGGKGSRRCKGTKPSYTIAGNEQMRHPANK